MNSITRIVATACVVFVAGDTARAEVTLNSVRVAATDTVAVAKFYQSAFGMHEVNRIDAPGGPEIFVNFGATADQAKANTGMPMVIMHRDSDATKDPIAHVIQRPAPLVQNDVAAGFSRPANVRLKADATHNREAPGRTI